MSDLRLVVHVEPDVDAETLYASALGLLADGLAERAITVARERRQAGLLGQSPPAPPDASPRPRRGRRA